MATTNLGALLLRKRLREAGRGSNKDLAEKMHVGPDVVSRWTGGATKPTTRYRVQIRDAYGIDLLAWDEERERHQEPDPEADDCDNEGEPKPTEAA